MSLLRVVLADDHALVRAGIRKLLESTATVEVVGEAGDGLALIALVEQMRPDIVLMDIAMPNLDGLETARRLNEAWPEIRILILSMHQHEEYVRQALRYGVAGYLLKDAAPAELDLAIKMVMRGETYLSPAVTKGVLADYVGLLRGNEPPAGQITSRQTEVLRHVVAGRSTKEIAQLLDLSVKTVETHRSNLMRQLDIHDVAGLVRYALSEGLIAPDR